MSDENESLRDTWPPEQASVAVESEPEPEAPELTREECIELIRMWGDKRVMLKVEVDKANQAVQLARGRTADAIMRWQNMGVKPTPESVAKEWRDNQQRLKKERIEGLRAAGYDTGDGKVLDRYLRATGAPGSGQPGARLQRFGARRGNVPVGQLSNIRAQRRPRLPSER